MLNSIFFTSFSIQKFAVTTRVISNEKSKTDHFKKLIGKKTKFISEFRRTVFVGGDILVKTSVALKDVGLKGQTITVIPIERETVVDFSGEEVTREI